MPGVGRTPKPKSARRTAHKPQRGDWKAAPGIGWQHGSIPKPPDGLMPASTDAWNTWLKAWWAAHWSPDDLPGLRQLIRLYDQMERGEFQRAGELRLGMDTYGITPKGQQDRRWARPEVEEEQPSSSPSQKRRAVDDPYAHLRVVGE